MPELSHGRAALPRPGMLPEPLAPALECRTGDTHDDHAQPRGVAGADRCSAAGAARPSADALGPLPAPERGARRPRHLDQARRSHRARVRRQQDPPARVPVRRHPGGGRRYRGRGRLQPVQLVPPDHRRGEEARPRGGAGAAARREGPGAAGQPAARPADGRRRHGGRPRQHGAPDPGARGEGGRARARRAQALPRPAVRPRQAGAGRDRLRQRRARAGRPARGSGHRARFPLPLRRQHDAGRAWRSG